MSGKGGWPAGFTEMKVPPTLAPFFQEHDRLSPNPQSPAATVHVRTLQSGDRAGLHSLFAPYPHPDFWQIVLGTQP